jgi:Ser/Thr protein kinase RdoA (MazF antagonist)
MHHKAFTIAAFFTPQKIISVEPFGNGNINNTYLVVDSKEKMFILQRLNPTVFQKPNLIIENQLLLQKIVAAKMPFIDSFHVPELYQTLKGNSYYKDEQNHYWRAQEFIQNSGEIAELSSNQANSVGKLLGTFHRLGEGAALHNLHDTLPGLHDTTAHIKHHAEITTSPPDAPKELLDFCRDQIRSLSKNALLLDAELHQPTIPKRLIHGDPKLANILFDNSTHKACSLIDLDTIGPGLIHHDLSDLIRSCCNKAGEDAPPSKVQFDLNLAMKIIEGYSASTGSLLTFAEIALIGKSIWLLPFELGVRFLNDYLEGSIYFKISSPHHNLVRAQTQLLLAHKMYTQQAPLTNHVTRCFVTNDQS